MIEDCPFCGSAVQNNSCIQCGVAFYSQAVIPKKKTQKNISPQPKKKKEKKHKKQNTFQCTGKDFYSLKQFGSDFKNATGIIEKIDVLVKYNNKKGNPSTKTSRVRTREDFSNASKLVLKQPCAVCGNRANHRHHIIPICRGGSNYKKNIIPLCSKCHASVHPFMSLPDCHDIALNEFKKIASSF